MSQHKVNTWSWTRCDCRRGSALRPTCVLRLGLLVTESTSGSLYGAHFPNTHFRLGFSAQAALPAACRTRDPRSRNRNRSGRGNRKRKWRLGLGRMVSLPASAQGWGRRAVGRTRGRAGVMTCDALTWARPWESAAPPGACPTRCLQPHSAPQAGLTFSSL